jgi:hypothetical protein
MASGGGNREVVADCPSDWGDEPAAGPEAHKLRLSKVFGDGQPRSLVYEYDFGDSWMHELTLDAVVELPGSFKRRLSAGELAFPPEDCGGITGYRDCIRAATARTAKTALQRSARLRDMVDWLGDWHPKHFDLEARKACFDQ